MDVAELQYRPEVKFIMYISIFRARSELTEKTEEKNLLELLVGAVIGTMRLLGKVGS